MIASLSVNMVRHPRGGYIVVSIAVSGVAIGAVIHEQESRHMMPKSVLRAVLEKTQFTLHATRRTPHGASRLVQAMSAWLVKTRRAPSRHSRDARVYGHTTTAMHKLSTPRYVPSFRPLLFPMLLLRLLLLPMLLLRLLLLLLLLFLLLLCLLLLLLLPLVLLRLLQLPFLLLLCSLLLLLLPLLLFLLLLRLLLLLLLLPLLLLRWWWRSIQFVSVVFVRHFGGGFDRGFLYSCFLFVFLFVVCFLFFRFRLCNGQEKAHLCRLAEHNFLNMPCGIMDQFVTSMAVPGD